MAISPNHPQTNRKIDVLDVEAKGCLILVIDDDDAMRSLLVDELSECGCRIVQAAGGEDAVNRLKEISPNLVVTDLNMKCGGVEFLGVLKAALPDCPIIVITAFGDAETQKIATGLGVSGYFDKPFRMADLKALVSKVCPSTQCQHGRANQ
jgi:DNA-binding NtrC family response regulator